MNTSINTSRSIEHGIDITKLFCAFLIVYGHSYIDDLGQLSTWFRSNITIIGVPFFFITSGYLFKKGLTRNNNSTTYLKKYVLRVAKMYFAWSIITLPVSWMCIEWGHPDYSFPVKIIYLFRMFLFSGSCGIYWYLLAMIMCSPIIFLFSVKRKEKLLFFFAVILFIVGLIYNSPYNNNNILFVFIHIVFGSERNFLNVGLFYMCIGYYFASHPTRFKTLLLIIVFFISIIVKTFEDKYWGISCMKVFIAVSLFILARNLNINISDLLSFSIRKLSTAIYLLHFPFLLVYDYYFSRGTLTGFFYAIAFSVTTYYLLKWMLPEKYMKLLFG